MSSQFGHWGKEGGLEPARRLAGALVQVSEEGGGLNLAGTDPGRALEGQRPKVFMWLVLLFPIWSRSAGSQSLGLGQTAPLLTTINFNLS